MLSSLAQRGKILLADGIEWRAEPGAGKRCALASEASDAAARRARARDGRHLGPPE